MITCRFFYSTVFCDGIATQESMETKMEYCIYLYWPTSVGLTVNQNKIKNI